jgi:hypothetical protein
VLSTNVKVREGETAPGSASPTIKEEHRRFDEIAVEEAVRLREERGLVIANLLRWHFKPHRDGHRRDHILGINTGRSRWPWPNC